MPQVPPRFVFAVLGARLGYAPARVMQEAGCLERLYTDLNSDRGWPRLVHWLPSPLRPGLLQRIAGRTVGGSLPPSRVYAFNGLGLAYALRRRRARSDAEQTAVFLDTNRRFGRAVVRAGFGAGTAVYTFNGAGLEILRAARERGLFTVSEQTIAPKQIELSLLREAAEQFPGWEPAGGASSGAGMEEFCAREREEWDCADVILCGSEFVREGIAASGGPAAPCAVVPYGLPRMEEFAAVAGVKTGPVPRASGPLRVLTVGSVGLRKGSPFVLEAARRMRGATTFRLVGPVHAGPAAARDLARDTELVGPVPRGAIHPHLAWADVFLLPSLCEGSAVATYEALAAGLPVITTPNTGSLVRDGVEGFILPVGDLDAIMARLELLRAEPERRAAMGRAAMARSAHGSLESYAGRLRSVLGLTPAGGSDPATVQGA